MRCMIWCVVGRRLHLRYCLCTYKYTQRNLSRLHVMMSQEGKLLSRGTCKDCQNMPEGAEVNIGNWTCEVDRPMGSVCARCSSAVQASVSPQIGALQVELSLQWRVTDAVQPCVLPQLLLCSF